MSVPIVERLSLAELKVFLTEQDLSSRYTMDNPSKFIQLTTAEGMDLQNSYEGLEAQAKLWIQYFPRANQFSLNVNFFANVDGASINPEDFLRLVPIGQRMVNYVNGLKIRWIQDESGVYKKHMPEVVTINLPTGFDHIYTK